MISRDSILRRLPSGLDPKQALFFDGIRHAAEIVAFSYHRLRGTLTEIAVRDHAPSDADILYTSAFQDAWSVVDSIDRFRALWKLLPNAGPHPSLPVGPTFQDVSESVRQLRNVADHLAQRADYIVARNGTALGTISWFTMLSSSNIDGVICTIVPGTIQARSHPMVNPAGKEIELPTGLIHLTAGEYTANLSAVIPEMEKRVRELEKQLVDQFEKMALAGQQAGADLLLRAHISFDPPPAS